MNPSLFALVSSMPWAPGPSRANADVEYGEAETCTLVKRPKIACHVLKFLTRGFYKGLLDYLRPFKPTAPKEIAGKTFA